MEGYRIATCRKGFTLVETMIVVSIIGLLSAIALPAFSSARSQSLNVTKKNNVRMLDNAVEMWAMDNFVLDGTPIGDSITNYIKGGIHALKVGPVQPSLTNVTDQTVGHLFTVDDLY